MFRAKNTKKVIGETLQGGVTGNQIRSPRLANLSQNLSGGQGKARRTLRVFVRLKKPGHAFFLSNVGLVLPW